MLIAALLVACISATIIVRGILYVVSNRHQTSFTLLSYVAAAQLILLDYVECKVWEVGCRVDALDLLGYAIAWLLILVGATIFDLCLVKLIEWYRQKGNL